ncbi:tRNA pseudouridine(38-40) synthase TruA [Phytomonospora endophytica]|uniref:tRNA pseudouridine synthase A n=1 Tax=Phytomonospora endophytica TaxID=714109 RepID=A0A841FZI7_9ACTN|nr:tRNA pseudouridine(38-40) synthase TruA [Phytomonospora endophytica]MBB6037350.1 tRNA pseudouridine38-40 synthase [Phytomonospora endophytica]GIG69907.1 tRNA pseudouridine synthase A [Phytomonospora endophytica]
MTAPETAAETVRLRLSVSYDGTDFHGWAPQPSSRTVAGEVRTALEHLFGPPATFVVAGRTDAGVHAVGQVCHADVDAARWAAQDGERKVLWRLRGILPPDVRVTAVAPIDRAFDARFSALARHYEYRISDATWGVEPLWRRDTLAWNRPLDVAEMARAAATLLGEHDFAAFCKKREGATTIRALSRLDVSRAADGRIVVAVSADAFCHSMVRSLVGALLAVGDGRREADWPVRLLSRTERSSEVVVAPAHGLTLVRVDYPADAAGWVARDETTRRVRTLER